jgi:hypothetical protein
MRLADLHRQNIQEVHRLKKLIFVFLSLLLTILIPGCFTFQAPIQNDIPVPQVEALVPASFSVTGISANTEPSNTTGCFTLYANITANGTGTVSYFWESTDGGGYSYTWNVTFLAAGTQKITLPVEMSALPSGTYRLHVLTPNDAVSNSTYYTTCSR